MEVLPITQDGCFTYNTRWQFYVQHSVADLHITQVAVLLITQEEILRIKQGESFTYNRV